MTKRMLIDSTHAEETRVVVLDGNRLDEYDVETSTKRQLKGNIYLAKVVRVEPSLQAAFIEYGGNRHGFLAFGEIHPDYYQIPVADRQRLLEMQEAEAREDEEAEDRAAAQSSAPVSTGPAAETVDGAPVAPIADHVPTAGQSVEEDGTPDATPPDANLPDATPPQTALADEALAGEAHRDEAPHDEAGTVTLPADEFGAAPMLLDDTAEAASEPEPTSETAESAEDAPVQLGGELETEYTRPERAAPRFTRNYQIQEVIRRRQILLIQVVKEERGSKGAALTTYVSLAGRFSVLMPNSPRGGGISRKITSVADRRRLKEITAELNLPRGMGLIVRTAGANRPKSEILRDGEYLLNQWDQICELTMKSVAPALIYEEASLIKRAIRDVYSRDVDDILVDGEEGWRAARDFMRMLMPTHAKKVQLWKDPQPLFAKAQVEAQLDAMLSPTVQLKSGGYLVINQTEALVAIDVNSGRSTRERSIEDTALRTNLEAADEAARQLRLRDLAGLIVIDFIDMESRRNNTAVEKRLKDALKLDRARIQLGSISHFGLLEMSRQRLRPSLAETSFVTCPHCVGTGMVRSTESAALSVLRAIEEEGGKRRSAEIVLHVAGDIALYILNHKRQRLAEVEQRYGMTVVFAADDTLLAPATRIERVRAQTTPDGPAPVSQLAPPEPFEDEDELSSVPDEVEAAEVEAAEVEAAGASDDEEAPAGETAEEGEQRRGRRRRRRGGRREQGAAAGPTDGEPASGEPLGADMVPEQGDAAPSVLAEAEGVPDGTDAPEAAAGDDQDRKRRGRRGGRRRRREPDDQASADAASASDAGTDTGSATAPVISAPVNNTATQPEPYTGPTPANPFGGASAYDIFDAIEQAEQERALATTRPPSPAPAYVGDKPTAEAGLAPLTSPATERTVEPSIGDGPASVIPEQNEPAPESGVPTTVQPALAQLMPEAVAPVVPEAIPEAVPVPTAVTVPEAVPVLEAMPEPAPEPEPKGPITMPILIGSGEPAPAAKKGWWRR